MENNQLVGYKELLNVLSDSDNVTRIRNQADFTRKQLCKEARKARRKRVRAARQKRARSRRK